MSIEPGRAMALCPHLIESASLEQPFALIDQTLYACPVCLGDHVETFLRDGFYPEHVLKSLDFHRCDHPRRDTDREHWPCVEAARAEVLTRWARASFTDKPFANRLRRVVQRLGGLLPLLPEEPCPEVKRQKTRPARMPSALVKPRFDIAVVHRGAL